LVVTSLFSNAESIEAAEEEYYTDQRYGKGIENKNYNSNNAELKNIKCNNINSNLMA